MRKVLQILALICISTGSAWGQKNILGKSAEQVKLFQAQQSYYANDFVKAGNIYKDLLAGNEKDANILGRLADVQYQLKEFDEAKTNAEKAKAIDPKAFDNTLLILGKLYHLSGKLDEALTEYNAYKASLNNDDKKIKESKIDTYIAQAETAKNLIAHPASVKIENLGNAINSEFDDKAPTITADGKTIIFTSRRPGKTSALDVEGDNKHFEDIYTAKLDTAKNSWGNAEMIPGSLNTEGHDAATSISPDGKQIFIYKNDMNEQSRGGDIYVSKLGSSGKWGGAKSMGKPINSSYWEGGGCISPDGKLFLFISERPGGLGGGDIYMAKKLNRTDWDTPVNIGAPVNTEEDEGGLFLASDGKTLFFSSKGHNTMGGYDIFKTVLENNKWTTPVNVGYPINTTYNDMNFSLTVDAKTGYFTSDRKGGLGERDIYKADLTNYFILEKDMNKVVNNEPKGPVMAILKGDVFDATGGTPMEAEITIYDETGNKVNSIFSSKDNGEYFITLPAGKTYQVKLNVDGYKPIDEKVEIKENKNGNTVEVKHYLLYKQ